MISKHAVGRVLPIDQSSSKLQHIYCCTIDYQRLEDKLSAQGSMIEATNKDKEAVQSPNKAIKESVTLEQRLQDRSRRESIIDSNKNYKLYTKAVIVSARGILELERV